MSQRCYERAGKRIADANEPFCEREAAVVKVQPLFYKKTANQKARRDVVHLQGLEPGTH